MRICRGRSILLCLGLVMGLVSVFGQDDLDADLANLSLEDLMNIEVVSATRSASKLSESPIPISVISAQDIESSGLTSIPDILQRLGEVDVLRVGRAQTEVSIRGKSINFNRRMLVLIDGRPEYNDLFGVTYWNLFPVNLDDIQRIEVVRGPASALFGANAFSGVINIITKQADAEEPGKLRVSGGNHGNSFNEFRYSISGPKLSFKLTAGLEEAESHETAVPFEGFNRIVTTNNFVDDEDSLDTFRGSFQLAYKPNDSWDIRLNGGYADGNMELFPQPGLPRERWDITNTSLHLTANYYLTDHSSLQFAAYTTNYEYETPLVPSTEAVLNVEDGHSFFPSLDEPILFAGEGETMDFSLQYVGSYMDSRLNVVMGAERRDIESTGDTNIIDSDFTLEDGTVLSSEKDITSFFTNFTFKSTSGKWLTGLGVRADDDSITDTDFGYTASLAYYHSEKHNLRFTARRAFRAPSLFELFSNVLLNVPRQNHNVRFRGNPGLEVETIDSYDLTYTSQVGERLQLTVELYHEEYNDLIGNPDSGILDLIEFDPVTFQFTTTTTFQNLTDAESDGFQVGVVWLPRDNVSVFSNFAYSDPDGLNDLSGETFFSPEYKVNAGIQWRSSKGFGFDADAHYVGETDKEEFPLGNISDDGPNFTRDNQQDYLFVNLKLGYKIPFGKGFEIYAAGYNIFDEKRVEYYEFDAVLKGVGEEFGSEYVGGIAWKF